jgi:hypothetical protein
MSLKSEIGDMASNEPSKDRQAWAEVTPDGGELSTGTLNAPLALETDWSAVLIGFGLDPNVFQIVDDTVRMSKWQSSKRLENGDRDLIWLYSYKARFKRKTYSNSHRFRYRNLAEPYRQMETNNYTHQTKQWYTIHVRVQLG